MIDFVIEAFQDSLKAVTTFFPTGPLSELLLAAVVIAVGCFARLFLGRTYTIRGILILAGLYILLLLAHDVFVRKSLLRSLLFFAFNWLTLIPAASLLGGLLIVEFANKFHKRKKD